MKHSIRLIEAELSQTNLYPGDILYIRCVFEATEDMPIDEEVKLTADLHYGHTLIDAGTTADYRLTALMLPQPHFYRAGEVWASSIRWEVPRGQWAGTFSVSVGMVNDMGVPQGFVVNGKEVLHCTVGEIRVAFAGVGKVFMAEHPARSVQRYERLGVAAPFCDHRFDAVIRYRNRSCDQTETALRTIAPDSRTVLDHISFVLREKDGGYALTEVKEEPGYELLCVELPFLYTAENSRMITMYGEGRIISPDGSYPWGYAQKYMVRNAAILAGDGESLLIETPYLDDLLYQSVCERDGHRFCAVGASLVYRVPACGKQESIAVINTPEIRMQRVPGRWQNCLPLLRQGITRKTDLYDRAIFYYYGVCNGPGGPACTFDEALGYIRRLHRLTGGVPQYMLLCGWQHEGHDTGYPDVFTLNPRVGTMDDLRRCVEAAKKYHACMTFHDNYDDMYHDNGYFDPEIAAMDSDGRDYMGFIWTSGVSVMTSYPKYLRTGKLQERVRKTVEMLPLDRSYHIDVLSQETRRYDFDPSVRAAAQENIAYKCRLIDEFEKYGVIVTSEGLTHPFAGKIGYAWRLNVTDGHLFAAEEQIPLTAMIYHGLVPYSGTEKVGLLFGANIVPGKSDSDEAIQKCFFLKTLPIGVLCHELMEDYSCREGVHRMTYSHDSSVIYAENTGAVRVQYRGKVLTENGMTLAPGYRENEYLGYSASGEFRREVDLPLPIAEITDFDGQALSYRLCGNILTVECAAGVPFRVITQKERV